MVRQRVRSRRASVCVDAVDTRRTSMPDSTTCSPARSTTVRSSWSWPARESASAPCSTRRSSIPTVGLVGDTWIDRFSRHTPDGSPNPVMQLTLMNARAAALVAQTARPVAARRRPALRGPRARLRQPAGGHAARSGHRGGRDHRRAAHRLREVRRAVRHGRGALVNSPVGREHNLRGVNARVITGGVVRPGDAIRKLAVGRADGSRRPHEAVRPVNPAGALERPHRERERFGREAGRAASRSGAAGSPPSASSTRASVAIGRGAQQRRAACARRHAEPRARGRTSR